MELDPEMMLPYVGPISLVKTRDSIKIATIFGVDFYCGKTGSDMGSDVICPAWAATSVNRNDQSFFQCERKSIEIWLCHKYPIEQCADEGDEIEASKADELEEKHAEETEVTKKGKEPPAAAAAGTEGANSGEAKAAEHAENHSKEKSESEERQFEEAANNIKKENEEENDSEKEKKEKKDNRDAEMQAPTTTEWTHHFKWTETMSVKPLDKAKRNAKAKTTTLTPLVSEMFLSFDKPTLGDSSIAIDAITVEIVSWPANLSFVLFN